MNLLDILVLGIGLSLDSFAVSLTLGCTCGEVERSRKVRFLALVGLFHFLMIVAGWFFGENVARLLAAYDHWIAFGLLALLGIRMIREGFGAGDDGKVRCEDLLDLRHTLLFAVALSIDALVTGFSLGMVKIAVADASQWANILLSALVIGLLAYAISAVGLLIGRRTFPRLGAKAEVFGGVILILIGVRILFEHLG